MTTKIRQMFSEQFLDKATPDSDEEKTRVASLSAEQRALHKKIVAKEREIKERERKIAEDPLNALTYEEMLRLYTFEPEGSDKITKNFRLIMWRKSWPLSALEKYTIDERVRLS